MRVESFREVAFLPFPISLAGISPLFKIYLKKPITYGNNLVEIKTERHKKIAIQPQEIAKKEFRVMISQNGCGKANIRGNLLNPRR
jgi:hypothetical protein